MTRSIVCGSASSTVKVVRETRLSSPNLATLTASPLTDDLGCAHSDSVVFSGLVSIKVVSDPLNFLEGAPGTWTCVGEGRKDDGLGYALVSVCPASYLRGLAALKGWFRNPKVPSGTKADEAEEAFLSPLPSFTVTVFEVGKEYPLLESPCEVNRGVVSLACSATGFEGVEESRAIDFDPPMPSGW